MNDGSQVKFLGGQQGKAGGKVESHLVTEYRESSGTGTILLAESVPTHVGQKIEILSHGQAVVASGLRRYASRSSNTPIRIMGLDST